MFLIQEIKLFMPKSNISNKNTAFAPVFFTDTAIQEAIAKEYLSIEVTTECNSNCKHCFATAGLTERTSLNMDTVRSAMLEGYELGYRSIHFTGGETLLWPHLMQALDEAFNTGYESAFINTNGSLLSKEKCSEFACYGDRLGFSLSLHGPKKFHESIRGSGAYKKTTNGLKNALDCGLKMNIFTSAGKSLLNQLPEFVNKIFNEFPAVEYMVLIQLIRVHRDSYDLSDELMSPKDFIRFVRTASMLSLYGLKVKIMENPLVNVLTDMLNIKWLAPEPPISRAGRAVIMADRNITVYHSSRDSAGIYTPGSLKKILFSEAYKKYVAADCSVCKDCLHMKICSRNGMTGPSEWFRDMHPEIPFCRRVLDEAGR